MEQFNPFTLEGKQILVTGASSGIGKAIAISCAKMVQRLLQPEGMNKDWLKLST